MYKSLFLLQGKLTASLNEGANLVAVDSSTISYIENTLDAGDYGYAQIQDTCHTEVIQILSASTAGLVVRRAQEGTQRHRFAEGAAIAPVTTIAGIRALAGTGTALTLAGAQGVAVEGQTLRYGITLQTLGTAYLFDNYTLDYSDDAGVCCGRKAPDLPLWTFPLRITDIGAYRVTRDNSYRSYYAD